MASGDPRLSIEERYASFAAYSAAVQKAVDDLIARGLMLQEDRASNVKRLQQAGLATGAFSPESAATGAR